MAIELPLIHDPASATFIARQLLAACDRSAVTALTDSSGAVVGFVVPAPVFTQIAQWAQGSSAIWSGAGETLAIAELWKRWPDVWTRGYGAAPVMLTRWDRPFAFLVFDLRAGDAVPVGAYAVRATGLRTAWAQAVDVLDTVESVYLVDAWDRPVARLISLGGYVRRYCG